MKLALSEISTVNASFAEDVSAYARAGFDGIGIWEFKLPVDDEANRRLLREAGLGVANCVPAVPSILPLRIPGMEGPPGPEERIEALCASVRRFAGYDPESVICLTGPAGDLPEETARRIAIGGLRRIAAAAREASVRLGLEPIRAVERDATTIVTSMREAVALLDEAGLADVGIMVELIRSLNQHRVQPSRDGQSCRRDRADAVPRIDVAHGNSADDRAFFRAADGLDE